MLATITIPRKTLSHFTIYTTRHPRPKIGMMSMSNRYYGRPMRRHCRTMTRTENHTGRRTTRIVLGEGANCNYPDSSDY